MAVEGRVLALGLILMTLSGHCLGSCLKVGFYYGKCNNIDIEDLIFRVVKAKYPKDIGSAADLIRLSFHDCFVRGCDASIFLDGKGTEKTALPNLTLGGFDLIDAIKATVEKFCPRVVSCADVLVIATRGLVHLAGGSWYEVETGRRDGFVSNATDAFTLPPPSISISGAIQKFTDKGLTVEDMVVLLGGHSVGVAHCSTYQDRLYNFQNTSKPDPSMSSDLLKSLRKICPLSGNSTLSAFLDQTPGSGNVMDNDFYWAILKHQAVLRFDQLLATDPRTKGTVRVLAQSPSLLSAKFGAAMVKMSRIGVLTGTQGEIRKSCRSIN